VPSPDPPKLHLNEHISPRLADQLRKYGFDVVSSQEARILSETDSQQLAQAVIEERAIVTFNVVDFVSLHNEYLSEGKEHWGIIFSSQESIHILRHRLLRLLNSTSADQLKNQIVWLNEFR